MKTSASLLAYRSVRLLMLLVAIVLCVWTIRATANFGLSRLFAKYALATRNLEVARMATDLMPADAQAHHTAATILGLKGSPDQSLEALEKAVAVRPSDYTLWLAVGLARDQLGNTDGAVAAFDEAVRRAPFYARPRWQRGNVLLRSGQYEAAFKDLNQAAESNPELIPVVIDLAWSLSQRDLALTEKLAQIQTPKMRIAFARLLAREGKASEAVGQLKAAGTIGDEIRRDLVQQLLSKGSYREAYEVWKSATSFGSVGEALLYDGGFEGPLTLNETGFGWRVPGELKGMSLSSDATEKHTGGKSLRIVFEGDSNPSAAVVSQMVLVEPSGRYRVNFAARPKDIVSGGPPIAVALDASDGKRLGQSTPLNKGDGAWQIVSFEFNAAASTSAVIVSVERESCATSPCPIFGLLSLDSFSMERVK